MSWRRISSASFSRRTPTTTTSLVKLKASWMASAETRMPSGLCAASTMMVGAVRTTSRRPGEVTEANASWTTSASSAFSAPKKASSAAIATAAFSAWCAPCSGTSRSS